MDDVNTFIVCIEHLWYIFYVVGAHKRRKQQNSKEKHANQIHKKIKQQPSVR